MKRLIAWPALMVAGLFASVAAVQQAASPPPDLAAFDSEVIQARRLMRRACGIAQELAAAQAPDTAKRAEATRYINETRSQWAAIQAKYANAPPAAYAGDRTFASRLASVDASMAQMISLLAANQPMAAARQACGGACATLVAMHEENGLVYALDRLFHLRRTAMTTIAAGKTGGPGAIRELVPELLHQRDRVLLAPCPNLTDAARCAEYRAALKEMSAAIDDLAARTVAGDREGTVEILNGLLAKINRTYGLAM
ncbi:MAG TPA: hypothetical protein PK251_11945 [Candidatus Latescibacteria bacterium]|nr:hypothetical protein [Candidatus Latescibacterota bacterium]HOS65455.1 hypothetical protein [Candidatus Latescibacterota bacterium]HPK74586.1 hypothetical protein [Candidatus Latescibacterota bacterium]